MPARDEETVGAIAEEGGDQILTEEEIHPLVDARAHWSLFVPAIVIAVLYGLVWLAMELGGRGDGALAKLVFIVFIVAPPLLFVFAFLRYFSTGVGVTESGVLVARGWPHREGEVIPLDDIVAVDAQQSWVSRRLGSGTVRLLLRDGELIRVQDIADPQVIAGAIEARIEA